jgi:4-amino-4-deoxy-L-arabinose transferase-like glycosyltransferase
MAFESSRDRKFYLTALCVILAIGAFLRVPPSAFLGTNAPLRSLAALHPNSKWAEQDRMGMDEGLYRDYVDEVIGSGLTSYPDIVQHYMEVQKPLTGSILPPMRFLYIFAAYAWHVLFGSEPFAALKNVASFFSVLTLVLSTAFAWRMKGPGCALGIAALMSFAPTQIHMSQHALVDGFFTFWALLSLWALWENLRAPRNWFWLATYIAALCFLVLTKENAFFVFVGIAAVIALNRWLQIGTVTRELLLATLLGPFLGVAILVVLVGGIDVLFTAYQLSVSKNYELPFAIATGDGPWYRYLIDLLTVSPVVLILAFGAIFRLDAAKKSEIFCVVFIAASYLVMCNIKYGMNLRYTIMWDMPLRVLAFSQIAVLCASLNRYRTLILSAAVGLICAVELRQYIILFVQYPLYELVPQLLLRALHIIKTPEP